MVKFEASNGVRYRRTAPIAATSTTGASRATRPAPAILMPGAPLRVEGQLEPGLRPGHGDQEAAARDGDPGGLHVLPAEGDVRDQRGLVLRERGELHLCLGRERGDDGGQRAPHDQL